MKKIVTLLLLMVLSITNAQIVNIPDANFKMALVTFATSTNSIASIENPNFYAFPPGGDINTTVSHFCKIDTNNDGEIQLSEAQSIKFLNVTSFQISDFTGIEAFTNLVALKCDYNQLTSINLSGLTQLEYFRCYQNQVSNLDVSSSTNLKYLICTSNRLSDLNISGMSSLQFVNCSNNNFTSLNLTTLPSLIQLYCNYNQLTNLNLSQLINLDYLDCSSNQLNDLNVSGLPRLGVLDCAFNQLNNLNISNLANLASLDCSFNQLTNIDTLSSRNLLVLWCGYNQFTSLDFSNFPNMQNLQCEGNSLVSLNIKCGNRNFTNLSFSQNPSLRYICADEEDVPVVQSKIAAYGLTNCHVNSYCSFTPGGDYYTINGTNRYDQNNNGCDGADSAYPNLKININSTTANGGLIADNSGNYFYDVQSGNYTMTPQLENPSYFNVSPATPVSVNFPTQVSPSIQNYCISPNGTHHDLEVIIIPLTAARPGFDVRYKIKYKNKGTHTEIATLDFTFDDAVMDFVNASSIPNTQNNGNLVWNIGSIAPFQSGEITVTFNLNSPVETPPVNNGDHLSFTATFNGLNADETPIDNVFTLNQTVANSFDPNDKTCLEGNTIDPSMVGQYVHYMIRFENTGTFAAANIVVSDFIDDSKFDVSSLQMVGSSHASYTRIKNNKVEFIFENINLPFDDANNDGWVVFKIKTLPTLAVNNTISNTANIYFDYNAPIVTNTATTTITQLSNSDFDFDLFFTIAPNPVKDVLNITTKNNIQISSVSIYNVLGQLVSVTAGKATSIDVSQLGCGTYFLRCRSEFGEATTKFVKE